MNRLGGYERERLMTAREAAAYLRISLSTLQLIERQGCLDPYRTPGGHRRCSRKMVDAYLETTREVPQSQYAPQRLPAEGLLS